MAFADSIIFNGKSIRDFLTEIIEVKGRGKPKIRKRSTKIIGRHGDFVFGQEYQARMIKIVGTIEGASHATLMTNIDNIKNLFAMDDQILATGEESIFDGVQYGKLEFGDESDRHYRAIYNGVNLLQEISHQWFTNDLKKIEIELRCDDPFAYASTFSEATMAGDADEFKIFNLGTANSESILESNGSVTNPVIVEGDRVGVAHFDYDDDLSDVEVNTVAGNFTPAFGFRTFKSLTSPPSKAIQILQKDNLYFDRGANIIGQNYINFNPHQGTIVLWIKPYFDGDDGIDHTLFITTDGANNFIQIEKSSGSQLRGVARLGGTTRAANITGLTSSNFGNGIWLLVVMRWDLNNVIDSSSNFVQIDLVNSSEEGGNASALVAPSDQDQFLAIGQSYSTTPDGTIQKFEGLIHWNILERALTDAEITDLFNSGAGIEPHITPDTKLLSAGELSGGDPVSVQYPYGADSKFTDGDQENDPSTEWGTSGSVLVNNNTNTVKYDLQSAQLDWTAASSNDYANLDTNALADNQDHFYRFWIFVNVLNASDQLFLDIVGNSTVLTRRLDTGTDDLGVSFATGKWLYFEGTFEADGAVAHEFRIRKLNANGDATVFVDQMDCQVSNINNGSMEGTYVSGVAPNWQANGTPTLTEENVIVHTGTASQKIVATSGAEGIVTDPLNGITFASNTFYILQVWARGGSGGETLAMIFDNMPDITFNRIDVTLTTAFKKFTLMIKVAGDTSGSILLRVLSGETCFIDDVSIIKLDTVTANSNSVATSEIDSYSEQMFNQGLLIDGGDKLSWLAKCNKNEGSIEVWLTPIFDADFPDDTDDPILVEVFNASTDLLRVFYDWTNDQFVFRKRASSSNIEAVSAVQTFVAGDRVHIFCTYGSEIGVQIYVDGVAGTANSNTASLSANPTTIFMSDQAQTIFPDSTIDELYIFSREYSAQEAIEKFNAYRSTKNDNSKIAMTKILSTGDKLRIDTENELIEFLDSSGGTFTNAIASMNAGSNFFKMNANESVIYNKVALINTSVVNKIKLNFLKRFL